jgi:hypothetical protein
MAICGTSEQAAEKIIPKGRDRRFLGAQAPRNDKNKRFTTAHLKVRPFKSEHNRVFQQPVKTRPDTVLNALQDGCWLLAIDYRHWLLTTGYRQLIAHA